MTRNIEQRLRRLESQLAPQPIGQRTAEAYFSGLMFLAIAFHLGDPQPYETPQTANTRALGYENDHALWNALEAKSPEIVQKLGRAFQAIFTKFGVNLDDEPEASADALERIIASLPEFYRMRLSEHERRWGPKAAGRRQLLLQYLRGRRRSVPGMGG